MMKTKLMALLIAAALVVSVWLAACGENGDATKDEAPIGDTPVVKETTVVLETTADGGTVEQDAEGNKITKDKDGKVIRVEDKSGNELDVTEYLTTHSWVEGSGSDTSDASGGESGSSKNNGSNSNSNENASVGTGKSGETFSSGSQEEKVEEEIPVVIATIPDDDEDLITLD